MPQSYLQSNNNILDLRGLLSEQETLTIIDVQGKSWSIAADLPLRTALVLLQHASAWEAGELTGDSFEATVAGMHAILKRLNPGVTRDDVLDGYSIKDMISVISFLSLRLRAQNEQTGEKILETEKSPVTPKPKRSHKKLKREN